VTAGSQGAVQDGGSVVVTFILSGLAFGAVVLGLVFGTPPPSMRHRRL